MTSIRNENTQFFDELTGEPLNNGYIYIGEQNLDPELNPKAIYPTRAMSGPELENPQRTGPDGRSINKIWVDGKYSRLVTDSAGVQKHHDPDCGDDDLVGNSRLIDALGVNDVVVTGAPMIQALVENHTYIFTAPAANTGAMTLQIDSLAAKSILKAHDQPMQSGDVKEGQKLVVVYNATDDIFELQSATTTSSFYDISVANDISIGGDISVGNIVDSNGNEIVNLSETASAVNEVDINNASTGNGPTISASGDDTDIDLNLAGKGAGMVKAGDVTLNPPIVAGHVRAGNVQINSGSITGPVLLVHNTVTEAQWETVGPTNSGADHTWTDLDALPSNATMLIAVVRTHLTPVTDTNVQEVALVFCGFVAGDVVGSTSDNLRTASVNFYSRGNYQTVFIPLDGDQTFKSYWHSQFADSSRVELVYQGFMTD